MAFDNKPNLRSRQFVQTSGDTMYYNGTNIIIRTAGATSGGTINSYSGYQVSGVTVFDLGIDTKALQIGCNSLANGSESTVVGVGACAINAASSSVAIGSSAKACGGNSITIGNLSASRGTDSIVIGRSGRTATDYGIVIGSFACTDNYSGIAIGKNNRAFAACAIAIGNCVCNVSGSSFGLGWSVSGAILPTILLSDTKSYIYGAGDPRLSIGHCNPTARIDIFTNTTCGFKLVDGCQGLGRVLTSDANGYGHWCAGGATSANNGISKSGNNVYLGGALTGNTTITAAYTLNFCSGALLNTASGYQISGSTILRTPINDIGSIFIGAGSGSNFGANSIAIGCGSMMNNSSGTNNISLGLFSLCGNTSGSNNVAIGSLTLKTNTIGGSNTAVGSFALNCNTNGNSNTAIGFTSLACNTIGCSNTAVGDVSLPFLTGNSSNNTALGDRAGFELCCGSGNVLIGANAAGSLGSGSNNVIIGTDAASIVATASNKLYIANCSSCVLICGDFTGKTVQVPTLKLSTIPATGTLSDGVLVWNAATCTIKQISSGSLGGGALSTANNGLTANGSNVRLGGALTGNTTITGAFTLNVCNGAKLNTRDGYQISGVTMFRAASNTLTSVYVGCQSGVNATGNFNTGIGTLALFSNTTGYGNTASGLNALNSNTIGIENTAFGRQSLYSNTTGNTNTAIGAYALANTTFGCCNVGIGYNSGADALFNITTQSNYVVVGNNTTVCAIAKVAWSTSSDERDKMCFGNVEHGLNFVNELKPISYQFKESRECEVPTGNIRYGFKAQDILALEGENPVVINNEDPEHLKYTESYLIPIYANAIKELSDKIKSMENEIISLKNKIQ